MTPHRSAPRIPLHPGAPGTGLALILLIVFARAGNAAEFSDAAAYARFPVGARTPALGGGCAAHDHDSTALFTNPAGLAWLADPLAASMSSSARPFGQSLHFLSVAGWPTPRMALAAGALIYGAGEDIEVRTANTAEPDSTIKAEAQLYALGAGWRLFPPLNFGITLRLMNESIGETTATGVSGDIGLLYRPHSRIALAFTAQDAAGPSLSTIEWSTGHSELLVSTLRAGLSLDFNPILLVAELKDLKSRFTRLSAGIECQMHPQLILRAGLDENRIAAGLGVGLSIKRRARTRLDYSFAEAPFDMGGREHRMALTVTLINDAWKRGELAFPTERPEENPLTRRAAALFKILPSRARRARVPRQTAARQQLASLALAPLTAQGASDEEAGEATNALQSELAKHGVYELIKRDLVDQAHATRAAGACANARCAVELGQALSADRVIIGNLGKVENVFIVAVQLVSVKSGRALFTDSIRVDTADKLKEGCRLIALRMARHARENPASAGGRK